jgi:cytoskeletal protein CcmA (bactofilin family)
MFSRNRNDDDGASLPSRTPGPSERGEAVISILGPGMRIVGDVTTEGTVRIEGTVEGTIRAGQSVVVGREGTVEGDVFAEDAVVAGRVTGLLVASSRLELHATCRVDGDVKAGRMKLEEGALVNGTLEMGETLESDAAPLDLPARETPGGGEEEPVGAPEVPVSARG